MHGVNGGRGGGMSMAKVRLRCRSGLHNERSALWMLQCTVMQVAIGMLEAGSGGVRHTIIKRL